MTPVCQATTVAGCCEMVRRRRTHTQQHKMAYKIRTEFKFSDKDEEMDYCPGINASKRYFSVVELKKKFHFDLILILTGSFTDTCT